MKSRVLFCLLVFGLVLSVALKAQNTTTLSVDTQVAEATVAQGTPKHVLFHFHLTRDSGGIIAIYLNSINFTTSGSYEASDLLNIKLWAHSEDNLKAAGQLSSLDTNLGPGSHTISGLSYDLGEGRSTYCWITADISSTAVINHTVAIDAWTTSNFTVSSGTKQGSATAAGKQKFTFASLSSDYFRSQTSGNWGATSTWQSSHDNVTWGNATLIPTSTANSITVMETHTVSVAAGVTIDQTIVNGTLNVNSGVTLSIANGTGTDLDINGTMYVNGTLSNNGLIDSSSEAAMRFEAGSNYIHKNTTDAGTIPGATWDLDSTCNITGYTTNTSAPGGLNQAFGHFVWNCPGQSSGINTKGSLTDIGGDFTVASTGTGVLYLAGTTGETSPNIAIDGDFILTGGTLCLTDGSGAPEVHVSGNYNQTAGELVLCDSASASSELHLHYGFSLLGGEFNNSNGSATVYFDKSGSELFVEASGYSMSGPIAFVHNTGTILYFVTPTSLIQNSNANCTFTMENNTTMVIGHPQGISLTGNTGCIQVGGTRTYSAQADYRYYGSSSMVTGTGLTSCRNLIIDCTPSVTLTADATISLGLILSNGTLINNAVSPNLTMASSSTIYRHGGSISQPPDFAGSVSNFYYTACTTGSELNGSVQDLIVDAGAGANVYLNRDVAVNRQLNLRNGILHIGAHVLELAGETSYLNGSLVGGATSNLLITGGDTSYVAEIFNLHLNILGMGRTNGFVMSGDIQISNFVFTYPGCEQHSDPLYSLILNSGAYLGGQGYWFGRVVQDIGDSGFTSYPLGIKVASGTTVTDFSVIHRKEHYAYSGSTSIQRMWDINGTPSAAVDLTLIWPTSADNGMNFSTKAAQAWRNSGTGWGRYGTQQAVGGDPRELTVSTTSFSEWTVADEDQTLPVELSSFLVFINSGNTVCLNWITESETNVNGFRIYRGVSGLLSEATNLNVFIQATNTSQTHSYQYIDAELWESGTYYYWLEVQEMDGSHATHGPVHITYNLHYEAPPSPPVLEGLATVYPNPFNPSVTIKYMVENDAELSLVIYNTRGQVVNTLIREHQKSGTYNLIWEGRDAQGQQVPSGIYIARLNIGKQSWRAKLVLSK